LLVVVWTSRAEARLRQAKMIEEAAKPKWFYDYKDVQNTAGEKFRFEIMGSWFTGISTGARAGTSNC
jgi:hypothetical protein